MNPCAGNDIYLKLYDSRWVTFPYFNRKPCKASLFDANFSYRA